MSRMSALALLAFSSALAAAPVPREIKKEEKFEGTWQIESTVAFGRLVNVGAANQHWTLDAEGNMKSHNGPVAPDNARSYIQLVIDSKAKTLDYKYTQQGNPTYPGVYELTGDTLKVCCNLKGTGTRPTTAESGPDVYLWTLKRVKAEAKK